MWIKVAEKILAGLVLAATLYYALHSIGLLVGLDWRQTVTFYEFINRALLISVGIELVRLLFTHDVHALTDLMIFAVARKVLRPDIKTEELMLYVIAFAVLVLVDAVVDKLRLKNTN